MANISTQVQGRRLYVVGNTFPIKDSIKAAGGHWDGDQKAWWVGLGKQSEIQAVIDRANSGGDTSPARNGNAASGEVYDGEVFGKAKYKGKSYYIRYEGNSRQDNSPIIRLVTLDGKISFWAKPAETEITKRYQATSRFAGYGRGQVSSYPTLSGIRRFVEEKKEVDKGGECRRCNSLFASGKAAPYTGSGDYEDCSLCGCTIEILR